MKTCIKCGKVENYAAPPILMQLAKIKKWQKYTDCGSWK